MKILLVAVMLGSFGVNVHAQKEADMFKKIQANYEQLNSYSLSMNYELFKGWNGTEAIESYQGQLHCHGQSSVRKIQNSSFINCEEFYLSVDHENRMMVLSDPAQNEVLDKDLKKSLKFCRDVVINQLENGQTKIRLILKSTIDVPYSAVDIQIDKDYWLQEMTLYYSNQIDFSPTYFQPDLDRPKLKIVYDECKKNWKDKEGLLDVSKYLSIQSNEIVAGSGYEDYEIIDLRSK